MPFGGRRIQLNKNVLARSRVIAKGQGIRDIERLVSQYGGKAKNWIKKSSPVMVISGGRAEIHWYEHHGVGRVEEKIKWIDES
jgi:hypothetical protein